MIAARMRPLLALGAILLALLALGGLPASGAGPRQLFLPIVARELPPSPTPTSVPVALRIQYRAFSEEGGWSAWQDEGGIAGIGGRAMRAVEMRIVGGPPGATIKYRAHIAGVGWQPRYILNGGTAGSENGNPIEAVQVGLENAPGSFVSVEPFVQDWGWVGYTRDFWQAGTTGQGRRLEALRAYVRTDGPEPARIGVAYNANPRGMGYVGWQRNGDFAGTTGKVLPLDTFKVLLFNKLEGTSIQYRCWVQDSDWQPWQDEGGECGLFGTNKSIYAFEIRLFNPYPGTVFTYTGHFQNRGDLTWSSDNVGTNVNGTLGTPSEKLHLEGIRVSIRNTQARSARLFAAARPIVGGFLRTGGRTWLGRRLWPIHQTTRGSSSSAWGDEVGSTGRDADCRCCRCWRSRSSRS
jgi:uncharacterized protein YjdB